MTSNPSSRPGRTRLRGLLAASLAGIIVLLAGIWLGGHPSHLPGLLRGSPFERHRTEMVTEQALNILTERYYRPLERSSLVDEGLAGMVASLDDPYSRYIDPSSYAASIDESETHTTGIGIGATPEPRGLRVLGVIQHSPAAEADLMRGDLIVEVGSVSLADRGDDFGLKAIRGPAGSPVTLTFLRGEERHVVSIVRAKIVVPVAAGRMLSYHGVRIGYLRLTAFTEDAGEELRS